MKLLLFVILSSSLFFGQTVKQEPKPKDVKDFRGLNFGSTIKQAKKKFANKELKYSNEKIFDFEDLSFQDQIFDEVATVDILFTDQKFSKAIIKFENQADDYTSVLMEAYGYLSAKYGKFDEESLETNIFILRFPFTTIALFYDKKGRCVNIIYESKLFTEWKNDNKGKDKI